jgi:hypothetical protein
MKKLLLLALILGLGLVAARRLRDARSTAANTHINS